MPAHRTRLAFEPLSPLLDIHRVVESTPNFEFAMDITCDAIEDFPLEDFEKLVLYQVVLSGRPLVIRGFHQRLDKRIFSEKWLRAKYAKKGEFALLNGFYLILRWSILTATSLNSGGS
mgnify:CR=1 FL=1|jgi:hypothetical protein